MPHRAPLQPPTEYHSSPISEKVSEFCPHLSENLTSQTNPETSTELIAVGHLDKTFSNSVSNPTSFAVSSLH